MCRLLAVALLVLCLSISHCDDLITKIIPVRHSNAAELATLFGGAPVEPAGQPPAPTVDAFLTRCLANSVRAFPARSWSWQTYLESGTGAMDGLTSIEPYVVKAGDGPPVAAPGSSGPLKALLPGKLAPPVALLDSNSLAVTGTTEDIDRFREILDLLDKPRKEVVLSVTFLKVSRDATEALPRVDWNFPAQTDPAKNPLLFGFGHGDFRDLLRRASVERGAVATSVCAANNAFARLQMAEVLPHYVKPDGAGTPLARNYVRALSLELLPRINADDSVTLWLHSEYVAGVTGTGTAATVVPPRESRVATNVQTQMRAAAGETLLLACLGTDAGELANRWDDCGANRLCYPLVAITPVLVSPLAGAPPPAGVPEQ